MPTPGIEQFLSQDGGKGGQGGERLVETRVDEETARSRAKRGLALMPVFGAVALMVGLVFGDWVIAVPLLVLSGVGGIRLAKELKEPDRFRQLSQSEVVTRILQRPHLLPRPGASQTTADRLVELQDLLDRLEPQGSWGLRVKRLMGRWGAWLGAAGWVVFGVASALSGAGLGPLGVGLIAGGAFAAGGTAEMKKEARRRKAAQQLQDAMDRLRSLSSSSIRPPSSELP